MSENKNKIIIILFISVAVILSAILVINVISSQKKPTKLKPFEAQIPVGPPPLPPETNPTETQKILKQIHEKFESSKRESVPQPPNIIFDISL